MGIWTSEECFQGLRRSTGVGHGCHCVESLPSIIDMLCCCVGFLSFNITKLINRINFIRCCRRRTSRSQRSWTTKTYSTTSWHYPKSRWRNNFIGVKETITRFYFILSLKVHMVSTLLNRLLRNFRKSRWITKLGELESKIV